jgi:hypothetical protein
VPAARPARPSHRGTVLRQALAGLLVALLAALTPGLSAAPAGAARLPGRAVTGAASAATAAPGGSATGQASRRGLSSLASRSATSVGRRVAEHAGEPRHVQRQRGDRVHAPTCPGSGSADPTGPPSSYLVTTVRPGNHPLGGSHYPAAAGRAPPSSCGS